MLGRRVGAWIEVEVPAGSDERWCRRCGCGVFVTPASVQDRDGAYPLLALLRPRFSTITLIWADGGYAGRLVIWAKSALRLAVTIVKRSDDTTGFVVLPHRWVVERTFGWLLRHRRLVRERTTTRAP